MKEYIFKANDDGTWTQILTEEQIKQLKFKEIERKKIELANDFNPNYEPPTQDCSNNPYLTFGSKGYFTYEDLNQDNK